MILFLYLGWLFVLLLSFFVKKKYRFVLFCVTSVWFIKSVASLPIPALIRAVQSDVAYYMKKTKVKSVNLKNQKNLTKLIFNDIAEGNLVLEDSVTHELVQSKVNDNKAFIPKGKYLLNEIVGYSFDSHGEKWKFIHKSKYSNEPFIISVKNDNYQKLKIGPPFTVLINLKMQDQDSIILKGFALDSVGNRYRVEKDGMFRKTIQYFSFFNTENDSFFYADIICGCNAVYESTIGKNSIKQEFRCELTIPENPFKLKQSQVHYNLKEN